MVRFNDKVWYFDENAKGWEATVITVHDYNFSIIDLSYTDKNGKEVIVMNVPPKDSVEMIKFHPIRKNSAGKPVEWNVKINCYKTRG